MENNIITCFDNFAFQKKIRELTDRFPFLTSLKVGKSVMGKDILALVPTKAPSYSLIVGGLDGGSAISAALLTAFTEELCAALTENGVMSGFRVRRSLMGRGVIILPCLNPDGCEIACLGKAACGERSDFLLPLTKNGFENFRYNARGSRIDHELSLGRTAQPEAAAFEELISKLSLRHLLVIGRGNDELILPEGLPQCKPFAELLASAPFPSSFGDATGLGIAKRLSEKQGIPSAELLLKSSNDPNKLYPALRKILMLAL